MSPKTTFWFVAFAAVIIGSALAVPLSTIDAPVNNNNENEKPSIVQQPVFQEQLKNADEPVQASDRTDDGTAVDPSLQQQSGATEVVTAGSQQPVSEADPSSLPTVVNDEKVDSGVPATVGDADKPAENADDGTDSPNFAAGGSVQSPDSSVVSSAPQPGRDDHRTPPRPFYPGGVHTVNVGRLPTIPFFMEFFQPPPAFQAFSPFTPNNMKPPSRQQFQPFPFGASIDPYDPFVNPMRSPSFNQLVNAYTNEFRNMLATLSKEVSQMENADGQKEVQADKPVAKTTTKTEIIDGHVVQINETTYSNGDANHKTFYHFKEIQVLPEGANSGDDENEKKTGNENAAATPAQTASNGEDGTAETLNVNTNEIVPADVETFAVVQNEGEKQNAIKKVEQLQ